MTYLRGGMGNIYFNLLQYILLFRTYPFKPSLSKLLSPYGFGRLRGTNSGTSLLQLNQARLVSFNLSSFVSLALNLEGANRGHDAA